ncbi:MAG: GFA family protein [Steroidobacteraceae bacterium]|jgi:hypothetical protein
MLIKGGCLCGAVRYAARAAPIVTRVCWRRLCQYLGAGSGIVNVCFPTAAITIEGQLADFQGVADSGNKMHRRFCPVFGTQLFREAKARPYFIFVRAGTLDDPEVARPAATIWTDRAPIWACIDDRIPSIACQPPPAG